MRYISTRITWPLPNGQIIEISNPQDKVSPYIKDAFRPIPSELPIFFYSRPEGKKVIETSSCTKRIIPTRVTHISYQQHPIRYTPIRRYSTVNSPEKSMQKTCSSSREDADIVDNATARVTRE